MKEFHDEVKGIVIGGRNFNNFRYADDAVYVCCSEVELQEIITRLAEVCRDYGMQIKKTKVMVISKTRNVPCKIVIDGSQLEKVSRYKYQGWKKT